MTMKILRSISACLLAGGLLLSPAHVRADPQGLDIGKVRLNLAFQPGPLTPGQFFLRGIIDDNGTEGLVADLLTNTATLRVQDGGDFDHTTTLEECEQLATAVYCKSDLSGFRVKAHIKRWKNLPDVWRLNIRVKDLTEVETGFGPLTGPVTVTLSHGATTRVDVVAQAGGNEGDCKVKKAGTRLRCKSQ